MSLRIASFYSIGKAILLLFLFSSCYKNHLYVQQEKVDQNFLASSYVKTPDPRRKDPPKGQRLLIAWDFPISLFRKDLTMVTTVRFWDQTQEILYLPLDRKRDSTAYYFADKTPGSDKKILTYRVQVFTKEGELLETWEHHFWTELVDVGFKESLSSAQRSSDSVSSQPKQASVIETP